MATIRRILVQHCRHQSEYMLTNTQRWLYAIKALICVLLYRCSDCDDHDREDWIDVCGLRGGEFFNGDGVTHWAETLVVGCGLTKNWYYTTYADSD